jgi:hypothetical protein
MYVISARLFFNTHLKLGQDEQMYVFRLPFYYLPPILLPAQIFRVEPSPIQDICDWLDVRAELPGAGPRRQKEHILKS